MSSEVPVVPVAVARASAAVPQPAIRAQNLGKCYRVYARPRDRLKQALLRRRRFFREFWALAELNLDIQPGETVGIIGRNGSGKSTLLQILCGTLTPTTGRVETRGRLAALLELGSGFHPEFTGRENVFLNARILGLSRAQTQARFEQIAAFADIGAFIDQPVKTYSSGMYVRLAFAVAANVDADILVIDEALAVGDVYFQAKCMRYLRGFKERGGTVIFVSHDAAAVVSLCQRAVWLEDGKLRQVGPAKAVCEAYFATAVAAANRERAGSQKGGSDIHAEAAALPLEVPPVTPLRAGVEGLGERGADILGVDVRDVHGRELGHLPPGQSVRLRVHFRANRPLVSPIVGFFLLDRLGQRLFGENTTRLGPAPAMLPGEERIACFVFDAPVLAAGTYTVTAAVADGTSASHTQHHWVHDACALASEGGGSGGNGLVGIPMQAVEMRGVAPAEDP